ncbi:hypothetical protein [Amycolatopsis pithecellobii]|uniref:Uncharacterized protein n=1 Tax=Amycolatopsis pithecellobii TaxID=664692 RepID=A0A6N7Z7A1_9PSEU|nr:hypothetical protein [Amycolatopsis pithecellobii]MTD55726.1 hypothetical protein [Amycolatopsis pithecellobii]
MSKYLPVADLVERWAEARVRTFMARETHGVAAAADYWAELSAGTEIAREVTTGRWVVVMYLLRQGEITSWAQVGEALDMTETEARDGFSAWIAGQRDLHAVTGKLGVTTAEAEELYGLVRAVSW